MSYIHEALKRAQIERSEKKKSYAGIMAAKGQGAARTTGPLLRRGALLIVMILLAFALYSWLAFKAPNDHNVSHHSNQRPSHPPQEKRVDPIEAWQAEAKTMLGAGRVEEAQSLYEKILKADPGVVDALNNLGVIHLKKKAYARARGNFEKAIRLAPGNVDPYYNVACVYAMEGETGKSLAYLKKAVSMDPRVKIWAQKDRDLENIRALPEFKRVIMGETPEAGA